MKLHNIIILTILSVPSLLPASCAPICVSKQLMQVFSDSTPEAFSTAINDNCDAVAVWIENGASPSSTPAWNGTGDPLVAAFYDSSTQMWSTPAVISAAIGSVSTVEAVVDIDNSGNAAVAWYDYDSDTAEGTIYTSYYTSGGSWAAPVSAAAGLGFSQLALVTTLANDSSFINVIYSDQPRQESNTSQFSTFISYIRSTDGSGAVWTAPANIIAPTAKIKRWDLSRSDNKNIVVGWTPTTLVSGQNVQQELLSSRFLNTDATPEASESVVMYTQSSITRFSIAINNSAKMAAAWAATTGNNTLIQSSFYDTTWPTPTTLSFLSGNVTGIVSVSLNNQNCALATMTSISTRDPDLIFLLIEYNGSTNKWEFIGGNPLGSNTFSTDSGVACNNDEGNAILFIIENPMQGINTSYTFFSAASDSLKTIHTLYNGSFIGSTGVMDSGNSPPPYAIDCKHTKANIALLTTDLHALVCCGLMSASNSCGTIPTNLTGSCNLNRFPFQGEFFAPLQWNAPNGGTSNITGYNIYQNNELVGSVPPTQTSFTVNNAPPNQANIYDVSSVDDNGFVGFPAEVTLNCS